jgi:hypothetical protein
MIVARKRTIGLVIVLALSVAFIAAMSALLVSSLFGPIPGPVGEPYQESVSPDGRWLVRDYYINGHQSSGWATVEPTGGGGEARTIYYGMPANFSWRDGDVVFTEGESRAEHVIGLQTGKYDDRTDDRLNLFGSLAMWAIPIALVLVFDIRLMKRWRRRTASEAEVMSGGS